MGVDVAPARRGPLELLAELAHEHVDRAVAANHRVAPQARVDLLALEHPTLGGGEELDQLELAPGQVEALAGDEGLEAVGADLDLAGLQRLDLGAAAGAPAASRDALHASDDLLGVARLGDPVIGAQAQPAHALGHGGGTGADDDAELGQRAAQALEPLPRLRAEHREIDDQRAQAHRGDRVGRYGSGEHAVLPGETVQTLAQYLDEATVAVEHRNAQRAGAWGAGRRRLLRGADTFRHRRGV